MARKVFDQHPTDLDNARYDDQREVMQQINERGIDPFMLEELRAAGQEPVKVGKYWLVMPNRWPYRNTRWHFLIISMEPWTDMAQITPEAGAEYFELVNWLIKEYAVPGGAVCMRFGDSDHSAGTVKHLHAQFVVPDTESEDYEPVRFKIGKDKEKLAR